MTGPVTTADGTVVTAATVDQLLLHDQYVGAGDTTGAFEENRVDDLGSLATAMMHALETQPLDLHVLADALSAAAEGRHLMLWSANPATEAVWRSIGVSGELTGDTLASNVINRGGNKLDQYLSVSNSLHLVSHADSTSGTLTMDLANDTPPGQVTVYRRPQPGPRHPVRGVCRDRQCQSARRHAGPLHRTGRVRDHQWPGGTDAPDRHQSRPPSRGVATGHVPFHPSRGTRSDDDHAECADPARDVDVQRSEVRRFSPPEHQW